MYKIIPTIFAVFLTSCSGDPYEDYLGLWERTDENLVQYEVMEITRDGETYLVNDNILMDKDFFGKEKKAMVLNKQEGQLSISTGFGGAQFGLSEDKQVLRVADQSYKKIASSRLTEIRSEIEREKAEREKIRSLCNKLKDDYKKERDLITEQSGKDWKAKSRKLKELKESFISKKKEITNCHALII